MMNETIATIDGLRTIHGDFSDKPVSDADLTTIIESSVCAANASARQSYSMVVLDDQKTMKSLFGYSGSRAIVYCVDFSRLVAVAANLGYESPFVDFVQFMTGSIDAMLVAQTAAIAAKSLGIDTLFTNGIHRADIGKVYSILNLPERYCFPLIVLVFGYPIAEPAFRKGRLSGPGVVHYRKYAALSAGEIADIVEAYDDRDRHLGLNPSWKEQGYAHYLDWFYRKWNGPTDPAKLAELTARLEKSGFM